ncbi:AtpZ/AtpI family protein [Bacteroidota bacterium]
METNSSKKRKKLNNNGLLKDYAKYFNIAFQMILIILICVFGGIKLDSVIAWDFPVFTVILSISGVVFAIYFAIKDFIK